MFCLYQLLLTVLSFSASQTSLYVHNLLRLQGIHNEQFLHPFSVINYASLSHQTLIRDFSIRACIPISAWNPQLSSSLVIRSFFIPFKKQAISKNIFFSNSWRPSKLMRRTSIIFLSGMSFILSIALFHSRRPLLCKNEPMTSRASGRPLA